MKLIPILEAGYDKVTGGLSDKDMIRKYFFNDQQLVNDIKASEHHVVKAFLPKKGLNVFYQYSGTYIRYILLLDDGTWQIDDEDQNGSGHNVDSLDGIQLHQVVYAQ